MRGKYDKRPVPYFCDGIRFPKWSFPTQGFQGRVSSARRFCETLGFGGVNSFSEVALRGRRGRDALEGHGGGGRPSTAGALFAGSGQPENLQVDLQALADLPAGAGRRSRSAMPGPPQVSQRRPSFRPSIDARTVPEHLLSMHPSVRRAYAIARECDEMITAREQERERERTRRASRAQSAGGRFSAPSSGSASSYRRSSSNLSRRSGSAPRLSVQMQLPGEQVEEKPVDDDDELTGVSGGEGGDTRPAPSIKISAAARWKSVRFKLRSRKMGGIMKLIHEAMASNIKLKGAAPKSIRKASIAKAAEIQTDFNNSKYYVC
eukprot:Cvel_17301.t1-p1 / transcript=Cvel_17301.t1 / gene=Cvel_17301 / organism=Chromera_velia_CCMP2878 / gene_product=hypothetical protein / transcript_product=hypothetical protein / location=Cvel_scaffold1373:30802-32112(-) / protein_length=319 / sequence_SO=supercontig / SO=protein_coding / is_pseudo=false